jgi:hypothetical protein
MASTAAGREEPPPSSSRPLTKTYSLRSIILFANTNVSRHILVVDTSILAKSNMGRREYLFRRARAEGRTGDAVGFVGGNDGVAKAVVEVPDPL